VEKTSKEKEEHEREKQSLLLVLRMVVHTHYSMLILHICKKTLLIL